MLQATLKVIGGKNDGKLIQFQTKKFLVGREQDCHLRPNSDLVSRHHCVFSLDDYALRLRDLGSTNGTLVNGRRIRGETLLTTGDVVRIGKLNLEVLIGDAARAYASGMPSTANQETTTNASTLETSHEIPQPTTLEDSGTISSPSGDTIFLDSADTETQNTGTDVEPLTESDTSVGSAAGLETLVDPTLPAQPLSADSIPMPPAGNYPQQFPQHQFPQGPWQYPQYPQGGWQYPQYPPPGYPMGYPPTAYPGYAFPGQYPAQYPQPGMPQPEQPLAQERPDSSAEMPTVRLPNPEDTGVKDEPKPATSEGGSEAKTQGSTPSQSAADLISGSRRRRRAEE